MFSAIMFNPDLGEVMFLIAFILFMIEFVFRLTKPESWNHPDLFVIAGLASLAFGFLAL